MKVGVSVMTKTEMLNKVRGDYPVYSVNILDINIGDKIKIVDEWRFPYQEGSQWHEMDKYLGRTMTVSGFDVTLSGRPCVYLKEDDEWWLWDSELIDSVVDEKEIQVKDLSILIEGL